MQTQAADSTPATAADANARHDVADDVGSGRALTPSDASCAADCAASACLPGAHPADSGADDARTSDFGADDARPADCGAVAARADDAHCAASPAGTFIAESNNIPRCRGGDSGAEPSEKNPNVPKLNTRGRANYVNKNRGTYRRFMQSAFLLPCPQAIERKAEQDACVLKRKILDGACIAEKLRRI